MDEPKPLSDELLNALSEAGQIYQEKAKQYEQDCDDYWANLSYEDKLKSFYSVCKRIYQGDIKDRGTYRWVLYDVFGFEPDAYGIGMECGYMAIHNSIDAYVDGEE